MGVPGYSGDNGPAISAQLESVLITRLAGTPLRSLRPCFGDIQDDDVVEQIVPKTSDPPFGNSVLPRAAVASADGRNAG